MVIKSTIGSSILAQAYLNQSLSRFAVRVQCLASGSTRADVCLFSLRCSQKQLQAQYPLQGDVLKPGFS